MPVPGMPDHLAGILPPASRQYQTLAMYFYERGFFNGHLGRAAAVAWLMFVLIVIFVLINTFLARRVRDND